MKKSLSHSITYFVATIVITAGLVIPAFVFFMSSSYFTKNEERILYSDATLISHTFQNSIMKIEDNIIFLSKTPPIVAIIKESQSQSSQKSLFQWKERLSTIFTPLLTIMNSFPDKYILVLFNWKLYWNDET